jgi:hypothetical protein
MKILKDIMPQLRNLPCCRIDIDGYKDLSIGFGENDSIESMQIEGVDGFNLIIGRKDAALVFFPSTMTKKCSIV